MKEIFRRFALFVSDKAGSSWSFILSLLLIIIWAGTGPVFHFSDTWQLVINTGTTIITFLMVFLIQNTQNRDSIALHIKLDEIIRSIKEARNDLIDLEECSDEEIMKIRQDLLKIKEQTVKSRLTNQANSNF